MARRTGVKATVRIDPAEASDWLLHAGERDVSVAGHNTVVAILAGAAEWCAYPDAHLVQIDAASEGLPYGRFETRFDVGTDGHPIVGACFSGGSREWGYWSNRRWRGATHTEFETACRTYMGALGYCLQELRASAQPVPASAGLWWTPLLVAGVVIVVVGIAAYAVRTGLTDAARIREDANTARAVQLVHGAVDDFRNRLQVYQSTGRLPAPSALETQAAAQVGQMADHFWETFASEATKTGGYLVMGLAALWAAIQLLSPTRRASSATA